MSMMTCYNLNRCKNSNNVQNNKPIDIKSVEPNNISDNLKNSFINTFTKKPDNNVNTNSDKSKQDNNNKTDYIQNFVVGNAPSLI